MHVFMPHNHCIHVCNDSTNSFPTQDAILKDEEEPIIDTLKEPSFNITKSFKNLLNTITSTSAKHQHKEQSKKQWKIAEDTKIKKKEQSKKQHSEKRLCAHLPGLLPDPECLQQGEHSTQWYFPPSKIISYSCSTLSSSTTDLTTLSTPSTRTPS
jgi:hypothetical protein